MANTWCAMHGCRPFRGEAGHPSVANEFAAIIHILCTARGRVDDIWHVRGGRGHSASRFTLAAGSSYRAPFHARRGTFRATFRCPVSRLPRVVLGRHSASHFTLAAGYLGAIPRPVSRSPRALSGDIPLSRFTPPSGSYSAPVSRSLRDPWVPCRAPFQARRGSCRATFRCPVSRLQRVFVGAISRPVSRSLRGPWVPFRAPFHARRLFCSGGIPLPRFTPAAGPSGRNSASSFTLVAGTLGATPRSVSRGHCGTKRGSRGTK